MTQRWGSELLKWPFCKWLLDCVLVGKMRSLYYPFSLVYQQPDSFMTPLVSKPACFATTLYQYSELISPSAKFLPWIKPTHCFLWSIWGQLPACTGASSQHSPAFLSVSLISSLFCSSWKLFQTFFFLKLLLTSFLSFSANDSVSSTSLGPWRNQMSCPNWIIEINLRKESFTKVGAEFQETNMT